MPPEETVSEKSVLDKPLHLLTEDDISQLTREDFRRYLKQKGMRRPSWNKSQAIQQVISLKALLDPTPEADTTAPIKKLYSPHNIIAPRTAFRGKSPDHELSEETALEPYERNDKEKPSVSGYPAATASDSNLPRTRGTDNIPIGQMIVFYSGKVNVYDDIAADKVRAILDDILAIQPGCCGSTSLQTLQTASSESRGSRKACVQRFLEKRKDRHQRMNVKYMAMASPKNMQI